MVNRPTAAAAFIALTAYCPPFTIEVYKVNRPAAAAAAAFIALKTYCLPFTIEVQFLSRQAKTSVGNCSRLVTPSNNILLYYKIYYNATTTTTRTSNTIKTSTNH